MSNRGSARYASGSQRDERADRYGGSSRRRGETTRSPVDNTSTEDGGGSGRSGRYNRDWHREEGRSTQEVERRRHHRYSSLGQGNQRGQSRGSSVDSTGGGRTARAHPRFEDANLQPMLQPEWSAPAPTMMAGVLPPWQQMMPTHVVPHGGNCAGPSMSPAELLDFLRQQQPASTLGQPMSADSGMAAVGQAAPPRQLPSVEEFVPVVPKSLMNLVRQEPSSGDGGAPYSSGFTGAPASSMGGAHDGGSGPHPSDGENGVLITLEPPKLNPDAVRKAREARRAHISGFPSYTTTEQLGDYFAVLLPEVRRVMTQREIHDMSIAAGDTEDEVRQIPPNAQTDFDEVRSLNINTAKSKPFGFVEVSLADLLTEMVEGSQRDPQRFLFTASDGRDYPIQIRRPRDYEPLQGVDEGKVVMTGFPRSLPEDKLRAAFEQFGELAKFEVNAGLAYAEYTNLQDAKDCRTDLHGVVLGNRMAIVLPLYDWLKVMCVQADIDVTLDEDDPVSGRAILHHLTAGENANGGGACAGAWGNALVASAGEAVAEVDHTREILEMTVPLPDVLLRLSHVYPHLRPLYGNQQVTIYPTRILVLLNLFDEEELTLDSTYSQLLADIEEEVEKYGRVKELIVPRRETRPRAPEPPTTAPEATEAELAEAAAAYEAAKADFTQQMDDYLERQIHPVWGGYGRVFVEYETVDEASEAQRRIAGKLFGNRTVITSFLFEDILYPAEEAANAEEEGVTEEPAAGLLEDNQQRDDPIQQKADGVTASDEHSSGPEDALECLD